MDTDSMYFALAYNKLEEAIKPELRKDFEQEKKEWLSWDKWSNREPGLFKLEKEGTRTIALCSKCYFVEDEADGQAKMSAKGVNKKQNEGAVREGSGGLQGHGYQPRLPDAPRSHVHVRAAQAGPFRVLRQALGSGGRHPHGTHRVPHA